MPPLDPADAAALRRVGQGLVRNGMRWRFWVRPHRPFWRRVLSWVRP